MTIKSNVRIGCVKYLNARPLIQGWQGEVRFDTPAVLCRLLSAGNLEVALVSSFEHLRNPVYRIVDAVSIASAGPVYSVVVAHREELREIQQIEADPASETSVNLLRCLLAEGGYRARVTSQSGAGARLLIGDNAIRFRQNHPEFNFWDLGQAWQQLTDLPFVYALWLIRPEVTEPASIAKRLRNLRDQNMSGIDSIIAGQSEFAPAFCARYYGEHLRFSFGDREKLGLGKFQRLCAKQGLLPDPNFGLDLV